MPSDPQITPYSFTITPTGITSLHVLNVSGLFVYVRDASAPFNLKINNGQYFRAQRGTTLPRVDGGVRQIEVAALGSETVTATIVVSNVEYREDAVEMTGEISVKAAGWSAFGATNSDQTVTSSGEVEIWTGDPEVDMVFIKHIAGTAPVRLASTDVGISPVRGIHLEPGEAIFLPIPLNGSVWAGTTGASVTLVCCPFYRS